MILREELTGEKLRELRKKFDMTQEDLSRETGIGRSRLSSYENGDKISKSIALLLQLYFEKKSKLFLEYFKIIKTNYCVWK